MSNENIVLLIIVVGVVLVLLTLVLLARIRKGPFAVESDLKSGRVTASFGRDQPPANIELNVGKNAVAERHDIDVEEGSDRINIEEGGRASDIAHHKKGSA